jgi:hypothetical protein
MKQLLTRRAKKTFGSSDMLTAALSVWRALKAGQQIRHLDSYLESAAAGQRASQGLSLRHLSYNPKNWKASTISTRAGFLNLQGHRAIQSILRPDADIV